MKVELLILFYSLCLFVYVGMSLRIFQEMKNWKWLFSEEVLYLCYSINKTLLLQVPPFKPHLN